MTRMHADEVDTDEELVRRLLGDQFPPWAALPVIRVRSYGTDQAIYRLGDDLAARLPRIGWATDQAALEREWLPRLAAQLPVRVPEYVAEGLPGHGYPFAWSVVTWLDGRPAGPADRASDRLAEDLADLVHTLRNFADGSPPPRDDGQRGGLIAAHDADVREAVAELGDRIDVSAVLRTWETAVGAEPPRSHAVSHGDLLPGNLLLADGRLTGVIDWGAFGRADPALDLLPAWNVLDARRRERLRRALDLDDDTWARGRGWAVQQALLALPYYWDTNPGMVAQASYALVQAISPSSRPS